MSQDEHAPAKSRREFLGRVAGTAAGVAAAGPLGRPSGATAGGAPAAANLLPSVELGPHRVTRLVIGGNPIYGYSHFNRLYSQHLRDYHTPERVVELLKTCTAAGINTWQNSYAPRTIEDVERCRDAGIQFHWLLLGKPDWDQQPTVIEQAARHRPIGIAPHGALAERLHRAGRLDVLRDLLKRIRDAGVLVGLSAHNPAVIELAEKEGWDVDYYMCCLYYLTRPRVEFAGLLGETPMGEIYLASDRARMLEVVRKASRPCLVYKVLAAGRADLAPAGIRAAFADTLRMVKPTDAMIVGMFQEFGDQVQMNAQFVRELCARQT